MASRKNIWDTLDSLEGKKDSSHANLQKELKRQGYKKNHFETAAKSKALKSKTMTVDYSKTNEGKKNIATHEARVRKMMEN